MSLTEVKNDGPENSLSLRICSQCLRIEYVKARTSDFMISISNFWGLNQHLTFWNIGFCFRRNTSKSFFERSSKFGSVLISSNF
jgi:putative flippase GtrA